MTAVDNTPIIVLGCGIIGLTTGIRLLESGKHPRVYILADHLPLDHLDPRYASSAAGAHHLSFAADKDLRQRYLDARTFEVFWDELEEEMITGSEPAGLMKVKQTEFYDGSERHLEFLSGLPDFTINPISSLPAFATHSVSFTSLTITPMNYLRRLLSRYTQLGGEIRRVHLQSLTDALNQFPDIKPSAIVVCTGLGSRDLKGVEDKDVYPTRGQVVRLRAPWCVSGYTRQIGSLGGGESGARTYVIPRFDGTVIVGGTREGHDWYSDARPETTRDVLTRVVEICPQLVPPGVRLQGRTPNWTDLLPLVEAEIVGFRPSRKAQGGFDSGLRLERGEKIGQGTEVIYNYGHGGFGWQSCWGCAEIVVELLDGSKGTFLSKKMMHAAGMNKQGLSGEV